MTIQLKSKALSKLLLMILVVILSQDANAQATQKTFESRIEPPFWWADMENPHLELMIYDANKNIKDYQVKISSSAVKLLNVHKVANPKYLFLELEVAATAQAGTFKIELSNGDDKMTYDYELKPRGTQHNQLGTLSSKDVIYLITPDRFANGDASNDATPNTIEKPNRKERFGRHGGDIQGIIDHLDYIKDQGFTAIWINPLLENDMLRFSYHGYAVTNHYKIDPRFGDTEKYIELVQKAHAKGLKVIMDVIYNHTGTNHLFFRDLPENTFFNNGSIYAPIRYREIPIADPYAADSDRGTVVDSWFGRSMPDLNQRNDRVKNFLIQNSIWWIEQAGVDAFRIDTYFYSDLNFSSILAKSIFDEYPNFGMFGETWVKAVTMQAYFTKNNGLNRNGNSLLPGITDFMLFEAIRKAYKEEMGFLGGIMDVYYILGQDFLYEDPYRNVIFLDNHDIPRIFVELGRDPQKLKSVLSFLLTTRGIPCIYYGTELAMEHPDGEDHGYIRQDFPGGWAGDAQNKFSATGRTAIENDIFNYIKTLLQYRKANATLQTGKLKQFIPRDGVYVYFRYDNQKTVMVVMNTHGNKTSVQMERFKEMLTDAKSLKNIQTGNIITEFAQLELEPFETIVFEVAK